MKYTDIPRFYKFAAEVNRWGQAPIMDRDGNMYVDFDPVAYAEARVADIEARRAARGAELEPEKREQYYQQYLDEGMKYADWEPPYSNVNEFLQLDPAEAMEAYKTYLNSWQPVFKSGRDEEGNYWSTYKSEIPSEIIDAKFGGPDAMNEMILGSEENGDRKALYRHLISGMPLNTKDDIYKLRTFMYNHKVTDEDFPDWDGSDEEWLDTVKDYMQRNVYDHIPKPVDPNQITNESGTKDGTRYVNAYNNRAIQNPNHAWDTLPGTETRRLTARNTAGEIPNAQTETFMRKVPRAKAPTYPQVQKQRAVTSSQPKVRPGAYKQVQTPQG